jgi:hypothetical protein
MRATGRSTGRARRTQSPLTARGSKQQAAAVLLVLAIKPQCLRGAELGLSLRPLRRRRLGSSLVPPAIQAPRRGSDTRCYCAEQLSFSASSKVRTGAGGTGTRPRCPVLCALQAGREHAALSVSVSALNAAAELARRGRLLRSEALRSQREWEWAALGWARKGEARRGWRGRMQGPRGRWSSGCFPCADAVPGPDVAVIEGVTYVAIKHQARQEGRCRPAPHGCGWRCTRAQPFPAQPSPAPYWCMAARAPGVAYLNTNPRQNPRQNPQGCCVSAALGSCLDFLWHTANKACRKVLAGRRCWGMQRAWFGM